MTYIFDSLRSNYLIVPGDRIALGTPIFTPYLEIPHMSDYRLDVIHINADEDLKWQYPKKELDKLRDPKVNRQRRDRILRRRRKYCLFFLDQSFLSGQSK